MRPDPNPTRAVARATPDPELRALAAAAVGQGWRIDSRGRHAKLWPPRKVGEYGGFVVLPRTTKDWRAVRNLRAELRRAGVELP